jgi:hypothetical protein
MLVRICRDCYSVIEISAGYSVLMLCYFGFALQLCMLVPHLVCGDIMEHMENESPEVKKQHEEGHHSSEVRTVQLK